VAERAAIAAMATSPCCAKKADRLSTVEGSMELKRFSYVRILDWFDMSIC